MTPAQLKAWRIKMSLSQVSLAKLLHHTAQAVYQWESGRRKVPGFLDVLLPLMKPEHLAQYRSQKKTRRQTPS